MKKNRGYWVNIYPKELQSQEPNFFETEDEAKKCCNRRFLIDRVFIGIEYYANSEAEIEKRLHDLINDPVEPGVATLNNSGGESATPGNEPVEGSPISQCGVA